jgi:hypothetical protein
MRGKISNTNFKSLKIGLEEVYNMTSNKCKSPYNPNIKFNKWDYILKKTNGFVRNGINTNIPK